MAEDAEREQPGRKEVPVLLVEAEAAVESRSQEQRPARETAESHPKPQPLRPAQRLGFAACTRGFRPQAQIGPVVVVVEEERMEWREQVAHSP